jgi:hypothetical protein
LFLKATSETNDSLRTKAFPFLPFFSKERIPMSNSDGQVFFGSDLANEIQPLLKAHGKRRDEVCNAIKEAYEAMRPDCFEGSPHERQSVLLQIALAYLFARKEPLWIHTRTEAGNEVTIDVLIEAYCLWGKARKTAREWGVDSAAAADALAKATHSAVDQRANNKGNQCRIRDVRKYIFAAFRNKTYVLALKQGTCNTVRVGSLHPDRSQCLSDRGMHARFMDGSILYQEFLHSLDPETITIVHARLCSQYGWGEASKHVKMPVRAARYILSKAIREGLGLGLRAMQFKGCNKSSTARTG